MSTYTQSSAESLCHTCLSASAQMLPIDANALELLRKVNVWNDVDAMLTLTVTAYTQKLCNVCLQAMESFNAFCARAMESAAKLLAMRAGGTNAHADGGVPAPLTNAVDANDDVDKIYLNEPLVETASLLLDNAAVTCDAYNPEPDPFGAQLSEEAHTAKRPATKRRSDEQIKCLFCNRSFSHKLSLDGHVRLQHEGITQRPFRCDRCAKDYTNFGALRVHITEIHEADECTYACDVPSCDRVYNSRIVLRNHKRKKHSDALAAIGDSSNIATTKCKPDVGVTKRSSSYHATKNVYKCKQCNRGYAHQLSLDGHVRLQHEGVTQRPFKCDRCDRDYAYFGGLQAHIKEAHEPHATNYPCDYPGCERVYASYIVLRKHKRTKHTGSDEGDAAAKRCICEICGATFCEMGNLNYHRRKKHSSPTAVRVANTTTTGFPCNVCGKLLHSPYSLKYHIMQQHAMEKKFKCRVCDRSYAKRFMLVQHMAVHCAEKVACVYCGKQFSRQLARQLQQHISTVHLKLKPFQCQYCEQVFACRKTLVHHEYIHTGEKPYGCGVCGKAYRQPACLRMHQRTHEHELNAKTVLDARGVEAALLLQQYVEL